VRGNELLDRAKAAAAKFAGDLVGPFEVLVNHTHQPHRFPLLGELMIDARVVSSKRSYTNDGYVNEVVNAQLGILTRRLMIEI